jgi:hypothetical protein
MRTMTAGLSVSALLWVAADWPQYRGHEGAGVSPEKGWTATWGAAGPKRLWEAQPGRGFGTVSVAAGRAYVVGAVGEGVNAETVFCYVRPAGSAPGTV